MRIGIIAWLHESNTFSNQSTGVDSFQQNLLVTGTGVRRALEGSHHEVGGFFAALDAGGATAVPIFAARALPSGPIEAQAFDQLLHMMLNELQNADRLDGILIAPHGATVSENFPDADGHWMSVLKQSVSSQVPIIGTLDAHANLSPLMVKSADALIAYRTNPHLDQRARGMEAAKMIMQTVRGIINPQMAAVFPPLAISIERQCTDEAWLQPLYRLADAQLQQPGVLSNSILLGFPYADVAEMGSSVITVTDGDQALAQELAAQLAGQMWSLRDNFHGTMLSPAEAVAGAMSSPERTCLLDMGDNVGGGSSADGTILLAEFRRQKTKNAFVCLFDPEAVDQCREAGTGSSLSLSLGAKTDRLHGDPVLLTVTVRSLHEGRFREEQPRHGGITEFDQGRTAVCETAEGLTVMLTSRRMVPFSLQQLYSCGLDPNSFHILVAKGVNAPIAAYRDVCPAFLRVNTPGSTSADMSTLPYQHRRRPLYPLEPDTTWTAPVAATKSPAN